MLMVRLQRVGRKHEPVFRLVLTDSKNGPKSGKFLEILGSMDMRRADAAVFKSDRVKHWLAQGAKLSDTVHNLFVDKKIIEGKKINVLPKKTAIKSEVVEEPKVEVKAEEAAPVAEETPVVETAPEVTEEVKTEEVVEEKVS